MKKRLGCRGTAYVEYFIAGAAMIAAAYALWGNAQFMNSAKSFYDGQFNTYMANLAGPANLLP